jgi:flagellar M-ring protein FliF
VVDDKGIARSKETHTETQTGTTTKNGGEPGVSSNNPQYSDTTQYQSSDTGETSNYESSDVITNYEINEKIKKQVYSPGKVERLSVSIILNNTDDEEATQKIKDSVQAAIGYNKDRNDKVTVTSLNFDDSLENEVTEAQSIQAAAQARQTYIYAGLIALILILLFSAFFFLRRSSSQGVYDTGGQVDLTVGEEMGRAEKQIAATKLSEEEKERRQMKSELEELINDRPEEVAQVLKSWLMED